MLNEISQTQKDKTGWFDLHEVPSVVRVLGLSLTQRIKFVPRGKALGRVEQRNLNQILWDIEQNKILIKTYYESEPLSDGTCGVEIEIVCSRGG